MEQQDIGTIDGRLIIQEILDSYTATFERDWKASLAYRNMDNKPLATVSLCDIS